jgi:hypothetical protein
MRTKPHGRIQGLAICNDTVDFDESKALMGFLAYLVMEPRV